MSKQAVKRADQSPMNRKQWCLLLSCGHEVWVTASRRPATKVLDCEKCTKAEAARGTVKNTCSRCEGTGIDPDSPDCRCDVCGGTCEEEVPA